MPCRPLSRVRRLLPCLVGVLVCYPGQGVAETTHLIGAHGCEVRSANDWARQKLAASLGKDQFLLRNALGVAECYAVVLEEESLLETRADFRAELDALISGMSARVLQRGAMRLNDKGPVRRAELPLDAQVGGVSVSYLLIVQSSDGLTHTLINWSAATNRARLLTVARQMADELAYPGPGSTWERSTAPATKTVVFQGKQLSFQARPAVMKEDPEQDVLLYLISPDKRHGAFVLDGGEHRSPDAMLDAVLESVNEGEPDPFRELRREQLRIGGRSVRQMVVQDSQQTGYMLAVPIGGGGYLDVRYVHDGGPDDLRADRELFFHTLSLSDLDAVVSLPALTGVSTTRPLDEHEQALLDASTAVGRFSFSYFNRLRMTEDAEFVGVSGSLAVLAAPMDGGADGEAEEQTVFDSERWSNQLDVVRWRGGWAALGADQVLVDASTGEPLSPRVEARLVARAGDGLIVVPPADPPACVGFPGATAAEDDKLVRLDNQGVERGLVGVPGYRLTALAAGPRGERLLAIATPQPLPSQAPGDQQPQLLWIDLTGGEAPRPVGAEWLSLRSIAAAADRWLITGQRAGGPPGVYELRDDGATKLLIAGAGYHGVGIAGDSLFFVGVDPPESDEQTRSVVYRAPLGSIAETGPLVNPFSSAVLNRVAAAWLAELGAEQLPPARDAEAVRRLVDAASEAARAVVGRGLPATGAGVDRLCHQLDDGGRLTPAAQLLVPLMVVDTLLDQGAEWVASERGAPLDWLTGAVAIENSAFAQGHTVTGLPSSLLYSDEGVWDPGQRFVTEAAGRRVLLGLDRQRIQQALAAATPAGADAAVANGDPGSIAALFEQRPENRFFRRAVYQRLAGAGRYSAIIEVAAPFADQSQAAEQDVAAWLAARSAVAETAPQRADLIDELHTATVKFPRNQSLYLLLGGLYEKTHPADPRYARLCYSRVVELGSWSDAAEQAKEGLARLAGKKTPAVGKE